MSKWYQEIEIEHFGREFREVAAIIGIENAIKLWDSFSKCQIYFSEQQLSSAKKVYIMQSPEKSAKELARELQLSERYITQIRQDESAANEPGLFG